ncbi:MAG: PorT family protein [Bacteroidales bacterium]|nr:MAG: PorT family protein [Bacteroidales bacterium]
MKRIGIFCLLLSLMLYANTGNAQSSLSIEASQLYSTFSFTDSQGTSLNSDYSGIFVGSYGLAYRYNLNNGITLRTGIGMRKAGATMVYDNMNYSWDLQYAEVKLGGGYILKNERISPYITFSGYYAYMLRGYQTINNEDINLMDAGTINETDFGITITPGFQFTFSDKISSFLEFNYRMGLQNLEKDEGQESKNTAYGLTLGLTISFRK